MPWFTYTIFTFLTSSSGLIRGSSPQVSHILDPSLKGEDDVFVHSLARISNGVIQLFLTNLQAAQINAS